jgi:hypothetical protein
MRYFKPLAACLGVAAVAGAVGVIVMPAAKVEKTAQTPPHGHTTAASKSSATTVAPVHRPDSTDQPSQSPVISVPSAVLKKRVATADAYAEAHNVRAGIAILDLATGAYYGGDDATEKFGSGSVMKVLIGTEMLATGKFKNGDTNDTEELAYSMITRSDDDAANALWYTVGGPDVIERVIKRYDLPFLGSPNSRAGYWGNTHITAKGMVYLYRDIKKDPVVGPWMINAMAHAAKYGKDGTMQFFGIPQATKQFAIKQGWGRSSSDVPDDEILNSTGYVDDGRYALALLTEGDHNDWSSDHTGYNVVQGNVLNQLAKIVMPKGSIGAT